MTLRAALLLVSTALLAACVSTGQLDPLKTDQGRDAARDAYIELGIGYLKEGSTENAKVPLKQALELDPSNADAHAATARPAGREPVPDADGRLPDDGPDSGRVLLLLPDTSRHGSRHRPMSGRDLR